MSRIQGLDVALVGGAGFIGHHLALALKAAGANVAIVDGLQVNHLLSFAAWDGKNADRKPYYGFLTERMDLLEKAGIPTYVQDARDYHGLSRALDRIRPKAIVHLAAIAHADRSNKNPSTTFDHSFRTLENALDFARGGDVERFVFFSSSMVYGNFHDGAVTEDSPCAPIGVYGATKLSGEKIVASYQQVFGLPYTIVRPSALYGERCVSRRASQIFVENALAGREVEIHGTGEERLDFTYVADLVSGITRILERDEAKNETFNLTYGRGRSINELVGVLREEFPGVRVKTVPKDRLVPERGTLSVDKARRLLGYEPRFPIEEGYRRYIRWYKDAWPR